MGSPVSNSMMSMRPEALASLSASASAAFGRMDTNLDPVAVRLVAVANAIVDGDAPDVISTTSLDMVPAAKADMNSLLPGSRTVLHEPFFILWYMSHSNHNETQIFARTNRDGNDT
ncbi:hypothetical protein Gogos_006324 [Gossypium gossypioides]|uniref:Uncharacterized protein n=1 Tax=Gossypium gossypioides TaxID=34282 RepID=A0A7J9C592_GOSGO|nr:hypothetical protein [Gossypium gossypioides]